MNTFAGFHLVQSASLVWLADVLGKGTIALLIVAIVNTLFRKHSAAAQQYWLWLVGYGGTCGGSAVCRGPSRMACGFRRTP